MSDPTEAQRAAAYARGMQGPIPPNAVVMVTFNNCPLCHQVMAQLDYADRTADGRPILWLDAGTREHPNDAARTRYQGIPGVEQGPNGTQVNGTVLNSVPSAIILDQGRAIAIDPPANTRQYQRDAEGHATGVPTASIVRAAQQFSDITLDRGGIANLPKELQRSNENFLG